MSKSAIATLNNARNLKGAELATLYIEAFSVDLMHLANANNEGALIDGAQSLKFTKAGKLSGEESKGLAQSMAEAIKATKALMPDGAGWIGSHNGPFSKASKEARAPYLVAHNEGVKVFEASLKALNVFPEPVVKTDEEKAKAKAEKAEKTAKAEAEAFEATKKALIESGEFIAKADIVTIDNLATSALVAELINRSAEEFSPETISELETLVMACKALHSLTSA